MSSIGCGSSLVGDARSDRGQPDGGAEVLVDVVEAVDVVVDGCGWVVVVIGCGTVVDVVDVVVVVEVVVVV